MVPTTTRHLLVIGETGDAPGFELQDRTTTSSGAVPQGDKIISALPDWAGRIWFASTGGRGGHRRPRQRRGESRSTLGERIGNSFAVDDTGGVYIVTNAALYRFEAAADGNPEARWRTGYPNTGTVKPGQTEEGSGTTPNVMTSGLRGDHRQRRPDERRGLQRAKQRHARCARCRCSPRAPATATSR